MRAVGVCEPTEEAIEAIADILGQFIDDLFRVKKAAEEAAVEGGSSADLAPGEDGQPRELGRKHSSSLHSALHDKVEEHRLHKEGNLHHHHWEGDAGEGAEGADAEAKQHEGAKRPNAKQPAFLGKMGKQASLHLSDRRISGEDIEVRGGGLVVGTPSCCVVCCVCVWGFYIF